ncbi:MAG: LacI family DNA-binding transcriptional regulator [Phycisphaeraceae bacterium]
MAVTLKHIADEAGVSAMTVSRALRGVSRISPTTRLRVRAIAERLGYVATQGIMAPPAIRSGRDNHTLRVLLPTVCRRIGAEGGSWWLDRMAAAMRDRLDLSNGRLVEQHFPDIDALVTEWQRGRYHGAVLRQPLPHEWVQPLRKLGAVVYAVEFDHQLGVDSVYSNEHRSAAMVLDMLVRRGHRQIAWLGILDRYAPYQVVFDAPEQAGAADRQAITVHGARHAAWANIVYCQLDSHKQALMLIHRDWRERSLESCVAEGLDRILALEHRPTAIVCSCDPIALALKDLLEARGLSVPEDMSIVTYGAGDAVRDVEPALTGVCMPMETIGQVIPELIERRLADPAAVPISVQFETTLHEGGSVADLHRP